MAVDPQAQRVLDVLAELGASDLTGVDPATARARSVQRPLPPGPAAEVQDYRISTPGGELALRCYRPIAADGALGGLVYFHGGGFVLGSIDGHDALCRQIAADASCAVVSVEYRLAPEHEFPAAVEDAFAATHWVHDSAERLGIDALRLAVGGDSAGGNLAAVVAALAKSRGGPPLVFQLLIYPVTDLRTLDTASYLENAHGYFLTRANMAWFRDHYLPRVDERASPLASPLARDDLSGLPPALVITAEYDPLRDEGEAYARALEAAGVRVTLKRYAGMIHGFLSMYAFIDSGRAAIEQTAQALRAAFAR